MFIWAYVLVLLTYYKHMKKRRKKYSQKYFCEEWERDDKSEMGSKNKINVYLFCEPFRIKKRLLNEKVHFILYSP